MRIDKLSFDHWKQHENYFKNHSWSIFQSSLLSFLIFYELISPNQYGFFFHRFMVNGIWYSRKVFISLMKDVANKNARFSEERKRLSHKRRNTDSKYMSVINVNYSILKCVINFISDISYVSLLWCFLTASECDTIDKQLQIPIAS